MSKLKNVDLVAIGLTGEDLIQIDKDLTTLITIHDSGENRVIFEPSKGLSTILDMISHLKEFGVEKPTEEEIESESETLV